VVPGYVTQHRQDLTEGNTIYEEISEGDDYIEISPNNTIHTRQYVAAVLNPPSPPLPTVVIFFVIVTHHRLRFSFFVFVLRSSSSSSVPVLESAAGEDG
jgi:hypothetical protein